MKDSSDQHNPQINSFKNTRRANGYNPKTKHQLSQWKSHPTKQMKTVCEVHSKTKVTEFLVVIILAIGPKVHRFKPSRGQWLFKGDFLWRGCKAMSSML
jgi:hypothetical protein